jgi:RNA polymerase-binding transcription factor DksA
MEDGILLKSIEGLGESPFTRTQGEIWEYLEGARENVARELLSGSLLHPEVGGRQESDPADEVSQEIEWIHRSQLEARLREIVEAQDRLMDGIYGRCCDCGQTIETRRLLANPAVALCMACQHLADHKYRAAPINGATYVCW